jgi:hypothetical protein
LDNVSLNSAILFDMMNTQSGQISGLPSNEYSLNILFNKPFYNIPLVVVTQSGNNPGDEYYSYSATVSNVTTNGFTVHGSSHSSPVWQWIAMYSNNNNSNNK